jgi:hypothetical protein
MGLPAICGKFLHRLPDRTTEPGDDFDVSCLESVARVGTATPCENRRDTALDQHARRLDTGPVPELCMRVVDRLVIEPIRIRNHEAGAPAESLVHRSVE